MADEAQATATPTAEPNRPNFREQALQRLQQESEPHPKGPPAEPAGESEVVEDDGPYPSDAAETAESELTEPPEETVEDETEPTDPDEEGDIDETDVNWQKRFEDAQAELKRQTANRREIEEGFRQRTEALITSQHQLEDTMRGVEHAAEFFSHMAEQGIRQFDGIDWNALKAKPEEYQQMARQFQIANQNVETTKRSLEAVKEKHKELREQQKKREADISRGILPTVIPNWGNEVYAQCQQHAIDQLNFTAEEVSDITDWRLMNMIYRDMQAAKAKEKVTQVKKAKTTAPNTGRNVPQPKHRNARGQFQNARQKAFENPGNRDAMRESFRAKLRAEREGR